MRPFVGLTNKARGYPGSILVCVLTNRRWLPLVGLLKVTQRTREIALDRPEELANNKEYNTATG